MSNYHLSVDFFGNLVRAETEGSMICANDLILAGNAWRASNGLPMKSVQQVMSSKALQDYKEAAGTVWGVENEKMLRVVGRGNKTRTMVHLSLAVFIAEQMSPMFHAQVIKTFVEGKLMEFRELGGSEFVNLNAAIDIHLPGRENKASNKGIFITVAKLLRAKILGDEADIKDWDTASVGQIHARYTAEKKLCGFLEMGLVKDYDHLKELIDKLK